jgi:hypothetical protein
LNEVADNLDCDFWKTDKNMAEVIANRIGVPCSLLIWDPDGYHKCRALPVRHSQGDEEQYDLEFYLCYYVAVVALEGVSTYPPRKEASERVCPRKYCWSVLEAKIGPAVDYALEHNRSSEQAAEALKSRRRRIEFSH